MTRCGKSPVRLSRRRRLLVNLTGLGVWGTGVVWLAYHYLLVRPGPFGPEPSPFEPWTLKLHGAFAFLTVWTAGLLWALHVVKGWRSHDRRWTGAGLFGGLIGLIASGYALYYVGDDDARALIARAHWLVGAALPLAYLAHRLSRRIEEAR